MADGSKLYRLRPGAKHLVRDSGGVLRPLEQGGEMELTDQVAHSLRDKFEPVTGPHLEADPEDQTLDQYPDPSGELEAQGEAVVGDQGNDEVTSPVNPAEYSVTELKDYINDDDDPWSPEDLEALAKAESADGSPRSGVLNAVTKRIAQLSKE